MIFRASKDYWKEIKTIYIDGIETNNATFQLAENIKDYSWWLSSKIENSCFLFKTEEAKIAGWSALSPTSSRRVYAGVAEVSVYVDLNNLGCGIGSKLLQELINFSKKNNIWTLQAVIFPENKSSIVLHEKFGFRKVGYREKIGKMHGQWRDTILFERRSKSLL